MDLSGRIETGYIGSSRSRRRMRFEGGGMREPQDGKPRFDLLLPLNVPTSEQFLTRCAQHMADSLAKYPERNWEQFSDLEAMDRARASAARHFFAWLADDTSEGVDHAAAVVFNLMAAEHVRSKLERTDKETNDG